MKELTSTEVAIIDILENAVKIIKGTGSKYLYDVSIDADSNTTSIRVTIPNIFGVNNEDE
jgi:hypothetical protein